MALINSGLEEIEHVLGSDSRCIMAESKDSESIEDRYACFIASTCSYRT